MTLLTVTVKSLGKGKAITLPCHYKGFTMTNLNPIYYLAASLADSHNNYIANELLYDLQNEILALATPRMRGMTPLNIVRVLVSNEIYDYKESIYVLRSDKEEDELYELLQKEVK